MKYKYHGFEDPWVPIIHRDIKPGNSECWDFFFYNSAVGNTWLMELL